jgi:hypothetical protein
MPGIGVISGKVIHALGKVQVRMIESLWVRHRRHTLDYHFPHGENYTMDGLDEMYVDLVDFAR